MRISHCYTVAAFVGARKCTYYMCDFSQYMCQFTRQSVHCVLPVSVLFWLARRNNRPTLTPGTTDHIQNLCVCR